MMNWRMYMSMSLFLVAFGLPAQAQRPEITPGLEPVLAPIQHQRYYLHERELFGYNPRFRVNTVQFGPDNRPYIRSKPLIHPVGPTTVQTLDDEGNWIKLEFVSALHSYYPNWDGQFLDIYNDATNSDDRIVFDDDGDAYMLLRLSGYGYNLMHSQDLCRTWNVYPLVASTVDPRLQFRDSYNDLQRPPVIVRRDSGTLRMNLYVITKNANGILTLTHRQVPSHSLVGGGLNGGKGMANLTVTKGSKTHIVYAGRNQVGDDKGTPQYVQTYDHTTDTFSDPVYLGSAGIGDPDVHNWPGITIDSAGYLHVVLGAHGAASGQRFRYTRSLVPNSSTDGWTPLENLAAGLSYLSLVCGTDDALHVVARHHWDPQQKLKYDRKKDGQSWETRRTLVIPFGEREDGRAEYTHYRQNLNIDRLGRLFLTYYSRRRIDEIYPVMLDAYNAKWPCIDLPYGHDFIDRPAMLISDDGGDTWRLAVTQDFVNGILD